MKKGILPDKEEPKKQAKSGIDLDDIAKFLGVK